jgi:TPR repeat protein
MTSPDEEVELEKTVPNDALLLARICHLEKASVEKDKEDGLEKVIPACVDLIDCLGEDEGWMEVIGAGPFSAWPFPGCTYKDWKYDEDARLYRCHDATIPCDCSNSTIHTCCGQAALRIEARNLDDAVALYSRAVQVTPRNDCEARLQAIAFCNLGIFLSSHLKVKSEHKFMKDDNIAVLLFKVGAVALKSPYSMYFYGHALIHGQGGVKKDEDHARSIHYLNEAGKERVGEAFYELGKIYEERGTGDGAGHSVNVDMISAAEGFYDAAERAYTFEYRDGSARDNFIKRHTPPPGAWTPSSATVRSLLHTEGWDALETSLSCDLGQRCSWAVAGQAFLFAGAITLTKDGTDKVSEEAEPFLWILPTLGIILALHSLLETVEAFSRIREQRLAVIKMVGKKLMAHGAILDASINDPYYSIQEAKRDRFEAWEKERAAFGAYVHRNYFLLFVSSLTVRLAIIADVTFIIAWASLAHIWPTHTWPVDTSLCSAHPDCAGLAGYCCPTFSGIFLDCCG